MKVLFFLAVTLPLVLCAPSADEVKSLPGAPSDLNFRQYSGYLEVNGTKKQLHYWLAESQNDPANDPLVLWLNGGPGCSSLDGYLYEHGPLLMKDENTLVRNPYAWNRVANMLYLEAPAGVGFSFSSDPNDYYTDDAQTSMDNYNALQSFFVKFPEYVGRDFYVTGESYGGVYVPTLCTRIMQGNEVNPSGPRFINLKAFAVGNGLSSDRINDNSLMFFAYYHGLFSDRVWQSMKKHCCTGAADSSCNFHDPTDEECIADVTTAQNIVFSSGLNFYGLYDNCTSSSDPRVLRSAARVFANVPSGTSAVPKLLLAAKDKVKGDVPCIDSSAATAWLNKAEVQQALHVKAANKWSICSDILHYNRTDDNVIPLYPDLLDKYRALVYNGDTDMACNFLGDQWAVASLNRKVVTERQPWHVGGQVAGFVEEYDNIWYLTVKGSGHMVPQMRPPQAYRMFEAFLDNKIPQ